MPCRTDFFLINHCWLIGKLSKYWGLFKAVKLKKLYHIRIFLHAIIRAKESQDISRGDEGTQNSFLKSIVDVKHKCTGHPICVKIFVSKIEGVALLVADPP